MKGWRFELVFTAPWGHGADSRNKEYEATGSEDRLDVPLEDSAKDGANESEALITKT
ncbi:hypothetical protein H1R20_g13875, partial [Candolleomyces eurysporus]